MNATDELTGVWYGPAGIRIEFLHHGDGWRSYTYPSRRRRFPSARHEYDTQAQVRDAISRLESVGYFRQPDLVATEPPTVGQEAARQWKSPGHVLGAFLLLVLILAVGMPVISSCGA